MNLIRRSERKFVWEMAISCALFASCGLARVRISTRPPLQTACPAGNCTWLSFQSLAICSQCIDITAQVKSNGTCRFNNQQYLKADTRNARTIETSKGNLNYEYGNGKRRIASGTMTIGLSTSYQYSMQGMIVSLSGLETTDTDEPVYHQAAADLRLPGRRSSIFAF